MKAFIITIKYTVNEDDEEFTEQVLKDWVDDTFEILGEKDIFVVADVKEVAP